MIKQMKLIYIEWADAVASSGEWSSREVVDEWGKQTTWFVKECGWLIEETDKYIVLASCWKEGDELLDEQFKHLMKIPKTWIRKRKQLKV